MKERATSSLGRELLIAFATVFAGALLVAVTGVLLLLPTFETPRRAFLYLGFLLAADVALFALFGRWLVHARVLAPLERMIAAAESVAAGDYGRRLPPGGTREVDRLAESLNRMAGRLISHQTELTRNIASLEETNRELTEARDELIRAEKMASLGQMAAGVAHEIGNPLAAIMGNLDLLKRRASGRELELVGSAAEQTQRIDRIVRGLLDYSRVREAKVRPIDVNAVVGKTLELIAGQPRFAGVAVESALEEALPGVTADPFQLEQVLVNLLLNAADAMDGAAERKVVIRTSQRVFERQVYRPSRRADDPPGIDYSHRRRFNRPERVPRLQPFEPGARILELRVEDTGPGIPADVIERIFEPFMTTKEPGKGTGLGLAVSARLIDGMGGTIQASNAPTGGASFAILLPAADEPVEPEAEAVPAGPR